MKRMLNLWLISAPHPISSVSTTFDKERKMNLTVHPNLRGCPADGFLINIEGRSTWDDVRIAMNSMEIKAVPYASFSISISDLYFSTDYNITITPYNELGTANTTTFTFRSNDGGTFKINISI